MRAWRANATDLCYDNTFIQTSKHRHGHTIPVINHTILKHRFTYTVTYSIGKKQGAGWESKMYALSLRAVSKQI